MINQRLKEFKDKAVLEIKDAKSKSGGTLKTYEYGKYWWHADDKNTELSSFLDFNREIYLPKISSNLDGTTEQWPDGAIAIRVDSNFWLVGILPWEFYDVKIYDIVETLWPDLFEQAGFEPDEINNPDTAYYRNKKEGDIYPDQYYWDATFGYDIRNVILKAFDEYYKEQSDEHGNITIHRKDREDLAKRVGLPLRTVEACMFGGGSHDIMVMVRVLSGLNKIISEIKLVDKPKLRD